MTEPTARRLALKIPADVLDAAERRIAANRSARDEIASAERASIEELLSYVRLAIASARATSETADRLAGETIDLLRHVTDRLRAAQVAIAVCDFDQASEILESQIAAMERMIPAGPCQ